MRTKRTVDIFGALVGLIFLAPLFIWLAIRIHREFGNPILFTQERFGRVKTFQIIKFRSMRDAFDHAGKPLPDSERLTPFGMKLRASSMDELPSLWNVLMGEMSLVGPRPLLVDYIPLYTPEQARRHDVRPGITGWAQVNGRNAITWEEKFELDVWYVNNQNFLLDWQILFSTLRKVVTKEGISANNEATMPRFTGSSKTR